MSLAVFGTTDEMSDQLVAALLAAFTLAALAASVLVVRTLLPLIRSVLAAVRTDDGQTVVDTSTDLATDLAAAREEIRDVRTELRSVSASQVRTDRRVDMVDDRVTDLSERVRVVEKSSARAHDRIDKITLTPPGD